MRDYPTIPRHVRIVTGVIAAALILLGKLFWIQIINDKYKINADNNAMVYSVIYPTRGLIYDRNGNILVGNEIAYDLMATPSEIEEFDTLALGGILDIPPEYIRERMEYFRQNRRSIGFRSVPFLKKISPEKFALFAEQEYRFPGFSGQARTIRQYPVDAGGNLLGYISEVDADFIKSHDGYKAGDYAGKTGIEATYEKELRGEKGYKIYLRNALNKIESSYKDGEYDKPAVPGNDIYTTIDAGLQQYSQRLMEGKTGSIVAIEPSTGEILTLVSSPGISTGQLADIGAHYTEMANDPDKPMLNRAVQSSYPPGSVFKLVNGLIGLQEGVFTASTRYPCSMGYHFGSHTVGCHNHKSPIDFTEAIQMSCNAYFCYVFRGILENPEYSSAQEAFAQWEKYVRSFGFGEPLHSDIPSETGGNVPSAAYYDRLYGKNRWGATTVLSLAIGQGELGCTPLHIANLCATIANRGHYYTPHIIKDSPGYSIDSRFKERRYTLIDTALFPSVIDGMYDAVNGKQGVTASMAAVEGLDICGKTGTAENPHGKDHSIFVCFAPKDDPKIAVAVYIENGGWGGAWAAPIASLVVEKYLSGQISESRKVLEERMMDKKFVK